MEVVFFGIFPIDEKFYSVQIDEIFVRFFHKSYYNRDILNACFMKLADLPLDQWLFVYLQKSLGNFPVDGDHAHSETCRQNDRPAGTFLFSLLKSLGSELVRSCQILLFLQVKDRLIDFSQRITGILCQFSLAGIRFLKQVVHDIIFEYIHGK